MKQIWKFKIDPPEFVVSAVKMPQGAKVLSVGNQGEQIMLWALVDAEAMQEERLFRVIGTGWDIEPDFDATKFVGTVSLLGGKLIFHIFELPQPPAEGKEEKL